MSKKQSETLTKFYKAYLDWLMAGALADSTFARNYGLCYNLRRWSARENLFNGHPANEMELQFEEACLDDVYPFDTPYEYSIALRIGSMHLNPKRIAWVKSHVS